MTELSGEIEDLISAHNRIYAIRQEAHNWLPSPEVDIEFNRLSEAMIHISIAVDILTGKTKIPEFPVRMELLDTFKMEHGYCNIRCFFQCPVCKTVKIDYYASKAPDSIMCEKCKKGLNILGKIEYPKV